MFQLQLNEGRPDALLHSYSLLALLQLKKVRAILLLCAALCIAQMIYLIVAGQIAGKLPSGKTFRFTVLEVRGNADGGKTAPVADNVLEIATRYQNCRILPSSLERDGASLIATFNESLGLNGWSFKLDGPLERDPVRWKVEVEGKEGSSQFRVLRKDGLNEWVHRPAETRGTENLSRTTEGFWGALTASAVAGAGLLITYAYTMLGKYYTARTILVACLASVLVVYGVTEAFLFLQRREWHPSAMGGSILILMLVPFAVFPKAERVLAQALCVAGIAGGALQILQVNQESYGWVLAQQQACLYLFLLLAGLGLFFLRRNKLSQLHSRIRADIRFFQHACASTWVDSQEFAEITALLTTAHRHNATPLRQSAVSTYGKPRSGMPGLTGDGDTSDRSKSRTAYSKKLNARLVTDLDQLYAQAACCCELLRDKAQALAWESSGMFPVTHRPRQRPISAKNEQPLTEFRRWEDLATQPVARAMVLWTPMKPYYKAMAKAIHHYRGDASRLTDLARETIVFETPADIAKCLRAMVDDHEIEIVRVRSTLDPRGPAAWWAGFKAVYVKLRIVNDVSRNLAASSHVCELILTLKSISQAVSTESYADYVLLRRLQDEMPDHFRKDQHHHHRESHDRRASAALLRPVASREVTTAVAQPPEAPGRRLSVQELRDASKEAGEESQQQVQDDEVQVVSGKELAQDAVRASSEHRGAEVELYSWNGHGHSNGSDRDIDTARGRHGAWVAVKAEGGEDTFMQVARGPDDAVQVHLLPGQAEEPIDEVKESAHVAVQSFGSALDAGEEEGVWPAESSSEAPVGPRSHGGTGEAGEESGLDSAGTEVRIPAGELLGMSSPRLAEEGEHADERGAAQGSDVFDIAAPALGASLKNRPGSWFSRVGSLGTVSADVAANVKSTRSVGGVEMFDETPHTGRRGSLSALEEGPKPVVLDAATEQTMLEVYLEQFRQRTTMPGGDLDQWWMHLGRATASASFAQVFNVSFPITSAMSKSWFLIFCAIIGGSTAAIATRLAIRTNLAAGAQLARIRFRALELRGGPGFTPSGPVVGEFGIIMEHGCQRRLDDEEGLSKNTSSSWTDIEFGFDQPTMVNGFYFLTGAGDPDTDPVTFVFEGKRDPVADVWELMASSHKVVERGGALRWEIDKSHSIPAAPGSPVVVDLAAPWYSLVREFLGRMAIAVSAFSLSWFAWRRQYHLGRPSIMCGALFLGLTSLIEGIGRTIDGYYFVFPMQYPKSVSSFVLAWGLRYNESAFIECLAGYSLFNVVASAIEDFVFDPKPQRMLDQAAFVIAGLMALVLLCLRVRSRKKAVATIKEDLNMYQEVWAGIVSNQSELEAMHKIEKVLASAKIPAHRVEHEMQTTLPDGFKSQFAPSRPRQNHGSMRRRLTTRGSGSSINVGQPSFEASSLPASPGAAARAGGGDWSPVAGIPRAATTGFSSRVSSDESEGWSVAARLDEFARAISAGRIMMPSMPGLRGARAATGPLFRQSRRLNGTLLPPKRKSQVRTQPVTSLSLLYKQAAGLQPLATDKVKQWAAASRARLPVTKPEECGELSEGARTAGGFVPGSGIGSRASMASTTSFTSCGGQGAAAGDTLELWEELEGDAEEEARVRWPGLKKPERAIEKLVRTYGGKVCLLQDLVRYSLVFDKAAELVCCLQAIAADPEVQIVEVKNRLRLDYDPWKSGGYRNVHLNLLLRSPLSELLGVDKHVFELQLQLEPFARCKSAGGHARYVAFRNVLCM